MRLTIIPSDNVVLIDGRPQKIDCSVFPLLTGVHAVQWSDGKGHVEYDNPPGTPHEDYRGNETLASVDTYADIIEAAKKAYVEDQSIDATKVASLRR